MAGAGCQDPPLPRERSDPLRVARLRASILSRPETALLHLGCLDAVTVAHLVLSGISVSGSRSVSWSRTGRGRVCREQGHRAALGRGSGAMDEDRKIEDQGPRHGVRWSRFVVVQHMRRGRAHEYLRRAGRPSGRCAACLGHPGGRASRADIGGAAAVRREQRRGGHEHANSVPRDRPRWRARQAVPAPGQCNSMSDQALITTTPATISASPTTAGASSRWPWTRSPRIAIRTIPAAAQMA